MRDGAAVAKGHLPELESLRGLAILLVVAFHYFGMFTGADGAEPGSSFLVKLAAAGNTGVTLFFVLSGFLLCLPFIAAIRQGRRVDLARFYWARILRILPLYYGAVLLALILTGKAESLKALLFIPIGMQAFPYSVPWWSLSVEVQFYLVLPWLMYLLTFRSGRYLFVLLILGWLSAQVYVLYQPGHFNIPSGWENCLFDRGGAFVAGGLSAWFYQSRGFRKLLEWQWVTTAALLLILASLARLFVWYSDMGQRGALIHMPMYHNIEAILWGALILVLLAYRGRAKPLLVNGVLDHFGRISYSMYLIHLPVQFYLCFPLLDQRPILPERWLEPEVLSRIMLSFLLFWAASVASYRLIEQPFLRFKRLLPAKPVDRPLAVPARE